ncbi:glutamate synthase large subunit [Virgibacillus chiguensis]|uniref:Glutamate synthase (NADPH/NADH) large chain/glutamate synthase (Ferredoxin) n=1 Tax=Virgibacillus chiguensis TaxID=411959 RepID=A0A1M5R5Q1_9BACI|nr:glutamate synthase large subunit [Virgibacillus chiguensis]SHH21714.1 glutamate synthase (NADPH/NADH) large chain/glutamate synthase (ferredoxin) [Virgibacillus chiguensis]
MTKKDFPKAQGLYHPDFEHEACGIGMIANINGKKTHNIVQNAINLLCNMEHRGGQSADTSTGDGAGILTQIPDRFFQKQCAKEGIELPAQGEYGVGMLFLPQDHEIRLQTKAMFEQIIREEGQHFLGWRPVPTNESFIGELAMQKKPTIRQIFIQKATDIQDQQAFERKLYVIRKRMEQAVTIHAELDDVYICSLSTTTIVYKGMLIPEQLDAFYIDLNHPDFKSALALVHSRFSTNTFPSWKRSHPNRYTIHNGEFNTLRGNVNWMRAREKLCSSPYFSEVDMQKILPVIDYDGSDSSIFDNTFEFLHLSGRSLAHTAMMMIPESWANDTTMRAERRDFYDYHSSFMEPWDGPAALVFSDGRQIGACLDRNGLRPARYYVTKDGMIVLGSEVGALDIFADDILYKRRLEPGRMLLVDLEKGIIVPDDDIKLQAATEQPYKAWLQNKVALEDIPDVPEQSGREEADLFMQQQAFGYTREDLQKIIKPLVKDGKDPIGSMGYDSPLAVLSKKPQLLYNYFKQLFAQVTNPPIDAIREKLITMTETSIGAEGNLVRPTADSCRQIRLQTPILTCKELDKIRYQQLEGLKATTLSIHFRVHATENKLETALQQLFAVADQAVENGAVLIILSDRGINQHKAAIPALLAVSGLHHHFIRKGMRTKISLLVETGEAREVHHFATLLGYGAEAITPYLAHQTIEAMVTAEEITAFSAEKAIQTYNQSVTNGIIKVLSKMGISTIQSYRGAQIFEAIGINKSVIDNYFTHTASRLGGIGLDIIEQETCMRHERAFNPTRGGNSTLESGDEYQYRKDGEGHQYNPQTIHTLQHACRTGNYELFQEYSKLLTDERKNLQSLRGLLTFKKRKSIPVEEVESVASICARFKTGAMSFGSISKEAHETLAIAMNRIGGRSNSGEGGESPDRFTRDANGDLRRSAIKQVASGRFGVNSHYLVHADEIQIKVAQGAKPGEGGQLPANKVYPWVAEVRGSTPGVELISPPPHHDIYSIEDLAELIYNLKNANPNARISVKLVSAVGVGTIAAGVAKGRADLVLISGYDGGTGAAPRTSVKHTGLPWEIGLAETHQTLLLNGLRDRIVVETDGKMMTGRDVVIASLLGAEEFGFSTAPLVALGCVMMRVCHLDTCPVGIATQNPELRKKFTGDPDHVVNFMTFIAQETREMMASLGFRTINEMIGRTDVLEVNESIAHWKAKGIDLSALLYQPDVPDPVGRYATMDQQHGIEKTLDFQELIPNCREALEHKQPVEFTTAIRNINRVTGTLLGSEVTRRYGEEGLPEDTIKLNFCGSAGQSFGAFIPPGMTLRLIGDANDFVGKGLSGGKLVVHPDPIVTFAPEKNTIIGNVAFYGASRGEAFIRGIAGERFAVRNSGATLVVEGVGDHGCEYMTGGTVVVLGKTGRNFAAGMSGGTAYVLDEEGTFRSHINGELVAIQSLTDEREIGQLAQLIKQHVTATNSSHAERILNYWDKYVHQFVKVVPIAYVQMQEKIQALKDQGYSKFDAEMAAFQASKQGEKVEKPVGVLH